MSRYRSARAVLAGGDFRILPAAVQQAHLLEPAKRPHQFERKLRNAIAEIRNRQTLEHNGREPAIGRRVAGAFLGDDQRVGSLLLRAGNTEM